MGARELAAIEPGIDGPARRGRIIGRRDAPDPDRLAALPFPLGEDRLRDIGPDGLARTIDWYLANESWWRPLRDKVYRGERLGLVATAAKR